jgi:hypothetical protein
VRARTVAGVVPPYSAHPMRLRATEIPIAMPVEPAEMLPLTAREAARMSASIVAVWVAVTRIIPSGALPARAVTVLLMTSASAVPVRRLMALAPPPPRERLLPPNPAAIETDVAIELAVIEAPWLADTTTSPFLASRSATPLTRACMATSSSLRAMLTPMLTLLDC